MTKKPTKTLSGLKLNFYQWTENQIRVTIQNPHEGKKAHITSVEHKDLHHGVDKARTHNNLFGFFKEVLEANDRWKNMETKLGKKRKDFDRTEMMIPISVVASALEKPLQNSGKNSLKERSLHMLTHMNNCVN